MIKKLLRLAKATAPVALVEYFLVLYYMINGIKNSQKHVRVVRSSHVQTISAAKVREAIRKIRKQSKA